MFLELSEEERRTLEGILEAALRDLRGEVYRAETSQFKEELKADETIIRAILAKLRRE
ncbi:MAG: hypothetical protein NZ869_05330 [Thermoanaerobaculum sp.]|nr:hypothetical protein [Thermoanaerobaculum sp.]MDW7966803.1 hypothetical protein [Thermoanaerobaculum sp.]